MTASDDGAVSVRDQTTLTMPNVVVGRNQAAIAVATLRNSDGSPVPGKTIQFSVQENASANAPFVVIGSVITDSNGVARIEVPGRYVNKQMRKIRAVFAGDADYGASSVEALIHRPK